jgi:hypothetical protein
VPTESTTRELAKEYPLQNEEELIRELLTIREKRVKAGPSGSFIRESHPKHHGCVRAEFTVEPDLPEELRVGVFAEARTFPAWIRFSNATGPRRKGAYRGDGRPDLRGMAIKLMGVDGEKLLDDERHETTQDFLLISADALIANDLAEFVRLLGEPRLLTLLRFFLNPFDLHLRELAIGLRSLRRHANPLEIRYSSVVPFLLGDRAVKYRADPILERTSRIPIRSSPDLLREAMQRQLTADEARFDVLVQVQTDPYAMPVENPSVVWDERVSPFTQVGTIRIPTQRFDSDDQLAFCENLSFTPWHSLPEHRPLGGLNRARRVVYHALSQLRHDRNRVPRREPTVDGGT